MNEESRGEAAAEPAQRRPLAANERRVLGVLIEKAKTTPDAYPLTLNALVTGCNQKSNRFPQTSLTPEDVEDAIESLREAGAATEVLASGRAERFKHRGYEWLGVDKLEIGVMAELLLRGPQTVGELRGRAARMAEIPDLAALRPVLDQLTAKGLMTSLTPPGRGQVVTHSLYTAKEMERIVAEHGAGQAAAAPIASAPSRPAAAPTVSSSPDETAALRQELASLRDEVAQLRDIVNDLRRLAAD